MQVSGNQPYKSPPHQEIDAGNGYQRRRTKIHLVCPGLELAHLVENAFAQKVAKAVHAIQAFCGLIERIQPARRMQAYFA